MLVCDILYDLKGAVTDMLTAEGTLTIEWLKVQVWSYFWT